MMRSIKTEWVFAYPFSSITFINPVYGRNIKKIDILVKDTMSVKNEFAKKINTIQYKKYPEFFTLNMIIQSGSYVRLKIYIGDDK